MLERVQAIILQSTPYREEHRMLTLLTGKYGLIRAIANKSLTPGTPLYVASQPFVQADFLLRKERSGWGSILQGEAVFAHLELRQDYLLMSFASACAEWVIKVAGDEGLTAPEQVYRGLTGAFQSFKQKVSPLLVFLAFQIQTLNEAGILLTRAEFAGWPLSPLAQDLLQRLSATVDEMPASVETSQSAELEVLSGLRQWIFDQTGIVLKSLKPALQLLGVNGND